MIIFVSDPDASRANQFLPIGYSFYFLIGHYNEALT